MDQFRLTLFSMLLSTFAGSAIASHERLPASQGTQQHIKELLKAIDLEHKIPYIMQFSQEELSKYPGLNIAITDIRHQVYVMLINEAWLTTFSPETQKFIIMHEAMHIKLGHSNCAGLNPHSFKDMAESRKRELEADRGAALRLHSIEGGIQFCTKMKKSPPFYEHPLNSHPMWQTRINALKKVTSSREYLQ